ncbi:MAG: Fur family transcriptional regulator [Candidatus Gracilibacteria bacterium]|nr:Fur family transcriptional regulator [Candidatus Gracilibacteria bacterium]
MNIENILKKNQNRVTPERIAIFDYIKTKHLFTYNDILDNFKSLGRASIFRTINLFLDLSIIRKIDIGESAISYELNDENHHHEHMKCNICNSIITFHSNDICKKIFEEAKNMGFMIKSHNIGIIGTCKNCLLNN